MSLCLKCVTFIAYDWVLLHYPIWQSFPHNWMVRSFYIYVIADMVGFKCNSWLFVFHLHLLFLGFHFYSPGFLAKLL